MEQIERRKFGETFRARVPGYWIGWLKIYEVLGSCTNVPDKAMIM